jgi:adenine/guanine phosphoribosyltransferase-like PRPP-binding protein
VDSLKNTEIAVENVPGIGYRFLRASANDGRFQQYSDHIKAELLYTLKEKVTDGVVGAEKIAELEKRVAQYVDNRVVIQLAKDNP